MKLKPYTKRARKALHIPLAVKDARMIINEFIQLPHYSKLQKLSHCRDFLTYFSAAHRPLISYLRLAGPTLLICTKHATGYQELNHDDIKANIKFLARQYALAHEGSGFEKIREVRVFSQDYRGLKRAKTPPPPPPPQEPEEGDYIELSRGEFKNSFTDPALYEAFEKLRAAIKANLAAKEERLRKFEEAQEAGGEAGAGGGRGAGEGRA